MVVGGLEVLDTAVVHKISLAARERMEHKGGVWKTAVGDRRTEG